MNKRKKHRQNVCGSSTASRTATMLANNVGKDRLTELPSVHPPRHPPTGQKSATHSSCLPEGDRSSKWKERRKSGTTEQNESSVLSQLMVCNVRQGGREVDKRSRHREASILLSELQAPDTIELIFDLAVVVVLVYIRETDGLFGQERVVSQIVGVGVFFFGGRDDDGKLAGVDCPCCVYSWFSGRKKIASGTERERGSQ